MKVWRGITKTLLGEAESTDTVTHVISWYFCTTAQLSLSWIVSSVYVVWVPSSICHSPPFLFHLLRLASESGTEQQGPKGTPFTDPAVPMDSAPMAG